MTDRTALPIPDYDQLPEGSLAHRIRSLPAPDLQRLLDYEQGTATGWLWYSYSHGACTRCDGSAANPAASPANNQPLRHGVSAQTPNRDIGAR